MMMVSASALVDRKGTLPAAVTPLPMTPMATAMAMEMTTHTVAMRREVFKFLRVLDGHEPQQDVGHTEVAQAPGQSGHDGQQAEAGGAARGRVITPGQVQIAGQGPGVLHHSRRAAGLPDAEEDDDDQGDGHEDGLDQVGKAHGHKAAHHRITRMTTRAPTTMAVW